MPSSFCLIIILVTQTTESNRQAVSSQDSSHAGTQTSAVEKPMMEKAMGGLSTLGDILTNGRKLEASSDRKRYEVPSTTVWVRLSKGFLANHLERSVDRKKPVRDYILGTTIAGRSHTTGKTRFVLYRNDDQALGEVEFVGEVHAKTVGRNGPATLHYLSDSTFRARKRVVIGESGLSALPAVAVAPTRLRATEIQTNLPWLRDRIVQRIAWRRVANTRSQANAIASDHTADDIRHDLDRKINESVASIQTRVQSQIAKLRVDGVDQPMLIRSRSTPDFVEIAVCQSGANDKDWQMPTFLVKGNPDIAVRVHQLVLAQVFRDQQLRKQIIPVIGQIFEGGVAATKNSSESERQQLNSNHFSMGGDWLVFDFTTPKQQESSPRIAIEEKLEGTQKR